MKVALLTMLLCTSVFAVEFYVVSGKESRFSLVELTACSSGFDVRGIKYASAEGGELVFRPIDTDAGDQQFQVVCTGLVPVAVQKSYTVVVDGVPVVKTIVESESVPVTKAVNFVSRVSIR